MGLNPEGWNKPSGVPAKQKTKKTKQNGEKCIFEVDKKSADTVHTSIYTYSQSRKEFSGKKKKLTNELLSLFFFFF